MDPTYDTPNGKKTLAEMIQGLQGAGWNGDYNDTASVIAAYNSTAAGTSAGSTSGSGNAAQDLLDAIASGDQQRFDEVIREYNVSLGENQRQFDVSTYSDLAQNLLGTAAQLRGPKDYFQFNQYTSGGRDLFQQLFGNQPRPDFSAPTGPIEPETIGDLMNKIGMTTAPGSTATGATAGSYNTANGPKTLDQMKAELKGANWPGNYDDVNAVVAAYGSTTGGAVTPATTAAAATPPPVVAPQNVNTGMHPTVAPPPPPTTPLSGVAASVGAVTPNTASTPAPIPTPQAGMAAPLTPQPTTTGFTQPAATTPAATPGAIPVPQGQGWPSPSNPQVPLPYQINPAVWDSMGPVGQQLTLSAAAAAGWDTDEFQRQINLSRPQGTAPASSTTQFKTQMGAFS